MRPMLAELDAIARRIRFRAPRLRIVSTVTGAEIGAEIASPAYWVQQIEAPVRFAAAVARVAQGAAQIFVEVGPGTALLGLACQTVDARGDAGATWVPSLRRRERAGATLAHAVARLYVRDVPLDVRAIHDAHGGRRVPL